MDAFALDTKIHSINNGIIVTYLLWHESCGICNKKTGVVRANCVDEDGDGLHDSTDVKIPTNRSGKKIFKLLKENVP